jgi:hypothetical protein
MDRHTDAGGTNAGAADGYTDAVADARDSNANAGDTRADTGDTNADA